MKALFENGTNEKRAILGAPGRSPYLFNVAPEMVGRFLRQLSLIDLSGEMAPEGVRKAITACLQEEPTPYRDYTLWDPGAFPEPALVRPLTYHVKHPGEVEEREIPQILEKIAAAEQGLAEPTAQSLAERLARVAEELAQIAQELKKG